MILKSIIIDGENHTLEALHSFIKEHVFDDIEVIATSNNFDDAVIKINSLKPDLIFLNIKLNKATAFDLLLKISNYDFMVVFVSANEDFIEKIFEYNTAYFIVEPITKEKVIEACKSAKTKFLKKKQRVQEKIENLIRELYPLKKDNFIEVHPIQKSNRITFLKPNEIIYLKSIEEQTLIYLKNEIEERSIKNLKYFEDNLPPSAFVKINNNHIININNIKRVIKSEGEYCKLSDNTLITVDNQYSLLLHSKLNLKRD